MKVLHIPKILPHHQSLLDESFEINTKLNSFRDANLIEFPSLDEGEKARRIAQEKAMHDYAAILNDRLCAMSVELPMTPDVLPNP